MGRATPLRASVAIGALTLLGCRSLDRFDTPGAAAYCGSIVGAPQFHEGFIPTNVPPSLGLHLELSTANFSTQPGTLASNDAQNGLCSADGRALFEDAKLRAIPALFHDTLSQLEFAEGHEHDLLAWVDSTCQGTMVAVVSLLTNGGVEVRLMKPAAEPAPNAGPEESPGYALFSLERSEQGCGF